MSLRRFSTWPASLRRSLLLLAAAILGFGLIGVIFWLFGPLFVLVAVPFAAFFVLSGGFLIVSGSRDAWARRSHPLIAASLVIAPVIVTVAGAASALPLIRIGATASTWVWFLAHRGTYREIARQVESGELVPAPTFYQKTLERSSSLIRDRQSESRFRCLAASPTTGAPSSTTRQAWSGRLDSETPAGPVLTILR